MALTGGQSKFYADNGYVVVENLVSRENLALLRQKIDEIQHTILEAQAAAQARRADAANGNAAPASAASAVSFLAESDGNTATAVAARPSLRKLADLAPNDEFFRSIACTPAILEIAAELTGGQQLALYSDQVFLKPAFCGSEKPLHQDNSYFRVTPHTAGVTCWMALDAATIENGCMRYIPGSHKLGLIPHKEIRNTPHLIPDVKFALGDEIPVPIPAGACIFHHLLVLHSSKANSSPHSRRAYALHYANRVATASVKPWTEMMALPTSERT